MNIKFEGNIIISCVFEEEQTYRPMDKVYHMAYVVPKECRNIFLETEHIFLSRGWL